MTPVKRWARPGKLGADVNPASVDNGSTPVFMAAYQGHTAAIEAPGRLGAGVNRADEEVTTPLRIAISEGHVAAPRCPGSGYRRRK